MPPVAGTDGDHCSGQFISFAACRRLQEAGNHACDLFRAAEHAQEPGCCQPHCGVFLQQKSRQVGQDAAFAAIGEDVDQLWPQARFAEAGRIGQLLPHVTTLQGHQRPTGGGLLGVRFGEGRLQQFHLSGVPDNAEGANGAGPHIGVSRGQQQRRDSCRGGSIATIAKGCQQFPLLPRRQFRQLGRIAVGRRLTRRGVGNGIEPKLPEVGVGAVKQINRHPHRVGLVGRHTTTGIRCQECPEEKHHQPRPQHHFHPSLHKQRATEGF